ncbi:MAG: ROK family transcriptional regulator [Devosia sp.]|nr:ROK family transcriptional regulator [Devosia sp.]
MRDLTGVQIVIAGERSKRYFKLIARGMQPAGVRQSNQRAVLTQIGIEPGLSNADLARRTELAPQTVSAVLADLEQAGLLLRGEVRRGRRGQPATPLFTNPDGAYVIGAEIGWTHLEVVLVNLRTQVIGRQRWDYDYPDAAMVFERLAAAVADLVGSLPEEAKGRLIGLALAAPSGLGDPSSLVAPPPGQAEIWTGIDIVRKASEVTGLDVQFFNDGNAACWAEFVAHTSPRPGNFAYLFIGAFVGAGIISQDRLWEGVTGESANLGSMLVTDRQGTPRFVHQIASIQVLRQRLAAAGIGLAAVLEENPPPEAQFVLAEWIEDSSFALAQTILNTATVLEFDFAIIDAELPVPLRTQLVEAVRRRILEVPSLGRTRPTVSSGHLGRSGAAQGAAYIWLYRRFFSRELEHMEG